MEEEGRERGFDGRRDEKAYFWRFHFLKSFCLSPLSSQEGNLLPGW
jgi:hypothetical protein